MEDAYTFQLLKVNTNLINLNKILFSFIMEETQEGPLEDYWKKFEPRIAKLSEKKADLQNRMKEIRWDTSKPDEEKEMELKNLSDEINATETKLIEQVKSSVNSFITLLELPPAVRAVFDERKRVSVMISPPNSPRSKKLSSPELFSLRNPSTGELPFFRTTSSTQKLSTTSSNKRKGINILFEKMSAKDEALRSPLEALDNEITELRAALLTATSEKNETKTHLRKIEDIREQLKLKVSRREKLLQKTHLHQSESPAHT